jgi:hypothetical protein
MTAVGYEFDDQDTSGRFVVTKQPEEIEKAGITNARMSKDARIDRAIEKQKADAETNPNWGKDIGPVATEGGMPASIIKHKQKLAHMSDEELADRFKDFDEQRLRQMAWRHGYGKMSSHYLDRVRNHMTSKRTGTTEAKQEGFAVRYLDPKNGKRFAVAFKTKVDATKKAAQLKSVGVKDISITQHNLNFKEDREIAEGFEWHTLSFLKRKGFNVARFSYGKLLVPKSDVEDVKKVLEKEYNKRDGDIFELPKKIVGESSFADLKHKSQPVEVREQFTTSQLTNLRKQWATVKTINPTGDKYKALVKWINDKEFKMVNQLARAKINFVSYIAKKALMDKWKFKKDTINKVYGGLLSNQYENLSLDKVFKEVSPPGWEGSVRAMKKHPELGGEDGKDGKNIYALAWYLKNKGAKSHYKDKGGKPVKKDKYKNEETEQHAQMISGVENEGRKETTNE